MINESPGGFALSGDRLANITLAIGQLVCLRPLAAERWLISVVRWLQQRGDTVEIGVQVMAPWGRVALLKTKKFETVEVLKIAMYYAYMRI